MNEEKAVNETLAALVQLAEAYRKLKLLGWKSSIYAPKDNSKILLIEVGSVGVHQGTRDEDGMFWIYDGETWPSRPILYKPFYEGAEPRVEIRPGIVARIRGFVWRLFE